MAGANWMPLTIPFSNLVYLLLIIDAVIEGGGRRQGLLILAHTDSINNVASTNTGKSYIVDNRGEYVSRYATDLINDLVCMKGHVNVERSDYVEFIRSMPEPVLADETLGSLETLRNRPKFISFHWLA
jgi:hypothetical protein